ncbi:hypothetical protein K9M74_00225 [Candidatus Woesearchaeota archaeon]|nr:hypothetical protein [Candidatus Woesearchaeota archaeon]
MYKKNRKEKNRDNNKVLFFLVLAFLFFLVFSSQVSAWGVYPARQHAENTRELQEFHVTLVNSEFKDAYFKVNFGGALSNYAVYNGGLLHFTQEKNQINIPFSLQLRDNLQPGKNTLSVVLQEVSDEYKEGVSSTVTLVAEVVVNIPFEGNVVSAQLLVTPQGINEPTDLHIGILNKGDDAVSVWADVVIKGPTNNVITKWTTDKEVISYAATGGITTSWVGNKNPGMYLAEVTLHYGDKVMVLRKDFAVGDNSLVAESISATDFRLGEIVPFEVMVYNNWNALREGVFAELFVIKPDGKIVQTFKTSPTDINALARGALTGYWDTKNLVVGNYDLSVLLNYDDKTSQETFSVLVSLDDVKISNKVSGDVIGGRGSAVGDANGGLYSLLVLLIVVLIVVNVVWIWIARKNIRGGGSKKK